MIDPFRTDTGTTRSGTTGSDGPPAADADAPGERIGPYKLLEPLGRGGMGEVWLADQSEPVRRQVAIKLIKPGVELHQVAARFAAERQALALMDHPNIAKVFDGGTTATGRPYFVMELVKGDPITKFCDRAKLTIRERFELMIPVCYAVQHAHQKGIIHRDLKPSNILITLADGKPVPKVIDFGVAKAVGRKLTDDTLFTSPGAIIGTLEYMAPEQAELSNVDIDTRADIYSLGVVLYELLTGSPPFSRRQLKSGALTEMLRLLREVEPSKPSTRLSTADELPTLAGLRRVEPRRLTQVRGELDWIAMKCLEKDRRRRYDSAGELAQDIQRFLNDEPVLAGPPSAAYRLRKFIHRNQIPVVAAALLLLSLVGGVIGTSWGMVNAQKARSAETEARADAEASARTAVAERIRAEGNLDVADDLSVRLADVIEKTLPSLQSSDLLRRDLIRATITAYQRSMQQRPNAPEVRRWFALLNRHEGNIRRMLDDTVESEKAYQAALAALGDTDANADRVAETLRDYALLLSRLGRYADALDKFTAAAAKIGRSGAADHTRRRVLANIVMDRSAVERDMGRYDAAAESAGQAVKAFRSLIEDAAAGSSPYDSVLLALALVNQSAAERARAGYDAAYPPGKDACDILTARVKEPKPGLNLDGAATVQGIAEYERCRTMLADAKRDRKPMAEKNLAAVALRFDDLVRRHPHVASYQDRLAMVYILRGEIRAGLNRPAEAAADFELARTKLEPVVAKHANIPDYQANLGRAYLGLARVGAGDKAAWKRKAAAALAAAAKAAPDDVEIQNSAEAVRKAE